MVFCDEQDQPTLDDNKKGLNVKYSPTITLYTTMFYLKLLYRTFYSIKEYLLFEHQ